MIVFSSPEGSFFHNDVPSLLQSEIFLQTPRGWGPSTLNTQVSLIFLQTPRGWGASTLYT